MPIIYARNLIFTLENKIMHKIQIITLSLSILSLVACQTPSMRTQNLDAYLQNFIGQSSDVIQQNLNFKTLGYQTSQHVEQTKNQLIYTILRPIYIPVAGSNASISSNAMGAPMIRYDTASTPHYDVNFNCKVVFNLENGIAKSINYYGKAC